MDQNQQVQPQIPNVQPPPQVNSGIKTWIVVAVSLLTLVLGGVGGYMLGIRQGNRSNTSSGSPQSLTQPSDNPNPANPTNTPTVTPNQNTDETASWNTFSSTKLGFSIKYPKTISKYNETWQYEEIGINDGSTMVGFGTPSSKSGGYIWGVSVYTNKTVDQLAKEQGQQFNDRKESRSNITVNGKPAVMVTVTTNQYPDWVSKNVYIEYNGKIYSIGNGAVEIPEFDSFYNSFKTLN